MCIRDSIGTAKPSLEDQKLVPHHLIDIIGPNDTFSAAEFKSLANERIKEIHSSCLLYTSLSAQISSPPHSKAIRTAKSDLPLAVCPTTQIK